MPSDVRKACGLPVELNDLGYAQSLGAARNLPKQYGCAEPFRTSDGKAESSFSTLQTIIAIVDDLFFASKIRGTAEVVGARVHFVKSISGAIEKAKDDPPSLIIADLNAGCCDPIEAARGLKKDPLLSGVPLLGFFSHVQTELQQAALAAGYDRVMPRSAFTKNLAEILAGNNQG